MPSRLATSEKFPASTTATNSCIACTKVHLPHLCKFCTGKRDIIPSFEINIGNISGSVAAPTVRLRFDGERSMWVADYAAAAVAVG